MNSKPVLLILAAGMGSRYGGLKQIEPVGPSGETILDYSIFDALRAGFGKIVFVIRRDIETQFRETIGARFERRFPVEYVFQELDALPSGYFAGNRKKPWGTGHAILMAADVVHEKFGVINADDFYGSNSFRILAEHLRPNNSNYAMVGFILRNTLSEFGTVARGVCRMGNDNCLQAVTETTGIERDGTGAKYTDSVGVIHQFNGNEIVSMNMWGFTPTIFGHLRMMFREFLDKNGRDDKREFYIPAVVNALVSAGTEKCDVLQTLDAWFGVTYRGDHSRVVENIRALISNGDYPEKLWT